MESQEYAKNNFDFSGIFPNCITAFLWKNFTPLGPVANHLTTLCSKFFSSNGKSKSSFPFTRDCQLVTYYLYHIRTKHDEINIDACCKYFYYKLKYLLMNDSWNCEKLDNCYNVMHDISKSISNEISSLFEQCSKYPDHLDEDIFKVFKKIDETYDNLYEFNRYGYPQTSKFYGFKERMKYLESCQNNYNESFKNILNYFNEYIEEYFNRLDPNGWLVPGFIIDIKRSGYIEDVLKIEHAAPKMDAITSTNNIRDTTTDTSSVNNTDNGRTISTGICFLFFAILIIMFILYKYTPFGSYIHPRRRRARKLMNRKNKECMTLNDSHKNMNNELNDKKYEIAYRSI